MKYLNTLIFLALATSLTAQKDPDAKLYLDKVSKDFQAEKALYIDFNFVREDLQNETNISGEGSLVLMDEKYKIELDEAVIYFDGQKQYSFNREIEEVYISIPDPEDTEFMLSDPIHLLKNYDQEFKYRLIGPATFEGSNVTEVQLYPEKLESSFSLLKLFFNPSDDSLKGISVRQKDGIVYTLTISRMEKGADPGTEFFMFDPVDYPNVDVIELMD